MIPPGDLLIFLDDKLIKWPISVDEEQGVILACTLNEKGQPYLDEQKGEVVKAHNGGKGRKVSFECLLSGDSEAVGRVWKSGHCVPFAGACPACASAAGTVA